jgi:ribonuclease D
VLRFGVGGKSVNRSRWRGRHRLPVYLNPDPFVSDSSATVPSPLGASADRLRSHRGRFRSSRHKAAHDDDAPARKSERAKLKAHPLVPDGKPIVVDDADALAQACRSLREAGTFAFDTEFIGENTYHPVLCLVQAATADRIWLIDPITVPDLTPFWELLPDASVRKVLHAGEQDLEPVVRLLDRDPVNVLDTQIAAGFCALPYPVSLARLVEYVSGQVLGDASRGIRLGKGLTFTQWDQRPLSKKQLSYAADDVRYLLLIEAWIGEELREDAERLAWMEAECRSACGRARELADEPVWARVKGLGGLSGSEQAIVRRLAAWRDEAAEAENLPPRLLLRDEVLVSLARRTPADLAALPNVKHLPKPVADRYGTAILDVVEAGKTDPPVKRSSDFHEPTLADKFAADGAWALLQTIGHARGIDPNVLASRREVELLVRRVIGGKDVSRHPLLTGWRADAAGRRLLDLLGGDGTVTLNW